MYNSLAKHALSGRYLVRPRPPSMDCKIGFPYLVPSRLLWAGYPCESLPMPNILVNPKINKPNIACSVTLLYVAMATRLAILAISNYA
jgi:hypothetical protein